MTSSPPESSEFSSPSHRTPAPTVRTPEGGAAAGLYIHVPFCRRKCPYCDFYSTDDRTLEKRFLAALPGEIALATEGRPLSFDTLYIGGGTPSLLRPEDVGRIIETARDRFTFLSDVEITLEMNPGTVSGKRLAGYRRAGIDRINIGVQSFNDGALRFLGRIHTGREAVEAVALAREAGFANIGIDLIYGLPGQSKDDWRKDLDRAAALSPAHLSCYMLTYESGTPMARQRDEGRVTPLPETAAADLFRLTVARLRHLGFDPYEISNFARSERFRSRHNLKYWRFDPYIGLGPSAHSFVHPVRWWNHRDTSGYLADIGSGRRPVAGREILTSEQIMTEAVYLGLRTGEGIDVAGFNRRFGVDFETLFADVLGDLTGSGHLRLEGKSCRLTVEGMLFLDAVAQRFVDRI